MTLREDLRPALRAVRRRPALLAVGLAIAVVQAVLGAAASLAAGAAAGLLADSVVGPLVGFAGGPLLLAGGVVVTLPLYAGVYAPVLDARGGRGDPRDARGGPGDDRADSGASDASPHATLARAGLSVRRTYGRLLAADAAAAAVAAGAGVLALALWLVAGTGVRYARYALADPRAPFFVLPLVFAALAFAAGTLVGGLLVRFADLLVLARDANPRRAWRASLRFARRHPLSLAGYGAVVAVVQGGPTVLATLVSGAGTGTAGDVLGLVLTLTLGSVGLTAALALTAVYFDRTVAPAVEGGVESDDGTSDTAIAHATRPLGARSARAAVAVAVLLAAVGGAVAVRTADVRPADELGTLAGERPASLPDDPLAAYEAAAATTAGSNHRVVVRSRNESDPDGTARVVQRSGIDYRDRQTYVYFADPETGGLAGSYFEEGTMATRNGPGQWSGPLVRRRGNWTVVPVPGYGLAQPATVSGSLLPEVDDDWTVARRNASTLVLRYEGPAVHEQFGTGFAGMGSNQSADSYAVAVVDRERGVVRRVVVDVHSRRTGRNYRHVVSYREVGTADLRRPDAIGERGALEWFWDVLYY